MDSDRSIEGVATFADLEKLKEQGVVLKGARKDGESYLFPDRREQRCKQCGRGMRRIRENFYKCDNCNLVYDKKKEKWSAVVSGMFTNSRRVRDIRIIK